MIAKISKKGNGFKGALDYDGKKGSQEIISNNLFTDHRAQEFRVCAENANISNPVFKASLSLSDGEYGTDEQWDSAVKAYLKSMGFDPEFTQYQVVRHTDTNIDHVHVIANKVQLDNKVVSMHDNFERSIQATKKAEIAGGFLRFDPLTKREAHRRGLPRPTKKDSGDGKLADVRKVVDAALTHASGDFAEFKDYLFDKDITVIENVKVGKITGLSFALKDDKVFKGSELGKTYSADGLQNRGLAVNPSLESENLTQMRAKRASQPAHP